MMIAAYIILGFMGYAGAAGVFRAVIEKTMDEKYWNDEDAPGFTFLSWAWPITLVCGVLYMLGKPTATITHYIARGGKTKPQLPSGDS